MRIGDILIAQERDSQINVNEFTTEKDVEFYTKGQLLLMVKYILMDSRDEEWIRLYEELQELGIGTWWLDKVKNYSYTEKLTKAGALLAAEIDRFETSKIKD